MSQSTTMSASVTPLAPSRSRSLSPTAAFYLLASITLSFLAGSSAPTAVYPIYQGEWGFTPVTITVIFGMYALSVLVALLFVGRLSDHVGRRPVLLVSTLMQVVAMAVMGTADGEWGMILGRAIQGVSTGAAVAAIGAGLVDIDKVRGTIANSIAPILGTAFGALLGGLLVHFLPAPTHLVYAVLGVVFALQFGGLLMMRESLSTKPGALASLKPQLALPTHVRSSMLLAVPVLIASWSLAGFYAALGPGIMKNILGFDASLFGGIALFVLAAFGGVTVLLFRNLPATKMMGIGATLLLLGVAASLLALSLHSVALFFLGTAVAGAGFGPGFQGAIGMVIPRAAPHERAGVLSVAFVVCYVAMGLPVVVAGFAIAGGNTLFATANEFGGMVMLLSAIAALGVASSRRKAEA